ncbi:MAG: JAB domain-containing protein [Limosilactobacillus gorillae]|jgi:DNA repair protein RadC|uniref:JAB domain-containing protein n=1 Tax=Limosilactobacillus gorillae TaxID=1450649 RepID=UPI000B1F1A12|nr:JAB domain-containing protein [Limosilactobacillus gorillae]MDO4854988.1 JAB domain-containing protein [Limosilactobacillus gorillae]
MLKQQLQFPLYYQAIHEALPDPVLAQYFFKHFPTPQSLHNITAEEEEELIQYDEETFKPLLAAVNLGTIAVRSPHDLYGQAASSTTVGTALIDEFAGEEQEMVVAMCTDVHNKIIATKQLFIGGTSECSTYPNQVFRYALKVGAYGVILAHNHPTGSPTPSTADMIFFKRMEAAGKVIGISLVDALVVGRRDYYSWQEARQEDDVATC